MKRFLLPSFAVLSILGLGLFAFLHSNELVVLNPQGPIGFQERWVMVITVLLCSIVVLPVFFILFVFAWRYRADNPHAIRKHEPNWDHDNWLAELVWWLVPAVIIVILGVIAWRTSYALDPFKPIHSDTQQTITIEAVALNWKWLFIYPDLGIASVNRVELPTGTPIRFEVTADAPMNQFWIPSLGGQVMAMPGMTNQLNLLASHAGVYHGLSSNISGVGFAGMSFDAVAVSPNDFSAWVESVRNNPQPLNADAYAALAVPSKDVPVTTYSVVDPSLYTANIMKYSM